MFTFCALQQVLRSAEGSPQSPGACQRGGLWLLWEPNSLFWPTKKMQHQASISCLLIFSCLFLRMIIPSKSALCTCFSNLWRRKSCELRAYVAAFGLFVSGLLRSLVQLWPFPHEELAKALSSHLPGTLVDFGLRAAGFRPRGSDARPLSW